ncbi:Short chain dehydrogenase [Modestobacter italicus]|uniref:Short chain dehydrogenase n=2 Tax=Modestobacter italicus (strain DSM 44449 / CECT 9708 / BC 501) TaxID=2732864 RepID=I4EXZ7_MODI5|nr:Short chain dehydrogenase [Modestobacter marinus]
MQMSQPDMRGSVAPGTVVVVTGGARGIGAGLSRYLAAQGAAVVTADVVEPDDADGGITHLRADVSDESSWQELVAAVLERHGRIDALVNNAAIYQGLGTKRPFTEITVEEWDRVLAVNTRSVWLGMRAVHPAMKAQGRGRVVNIASSTVHMGVPWFAHYTASKGAVIALTRSVAREVGADGITVNAVAPGLVETDATRALNDADYLAASAGRRAVPRAMEPGDLAPVVSFLCSEGSGFVTGQTLIVDGGVAFS